MVTQLVTQLLTFFLSCRRTFVSYRVVSALWGQALPLSHIYMHNIINDSKYKKLLFKHNQTFLPWRLRPYQKKLVPFFFRFLPR